ncbi:transcriptional regulator [Halomonas sp. MCCC 1A17488]|uniref:Transcriptional regulator n=1 Tax=Billgrantia sulfidoxydans TaxID=2733484 RepID=A0ABX7W6I4_9GAMM|nr:MULTISPECIES: transcriptional regulator [Halomonas]MCE8018250.1 transcriptional regulator [Halomonas sp. MCCC 1A17488]MCG3241583.1 transcriptional regulator [Halomonas sp. MCCC 1A17488]QPP48468.1 transcriptional regulator [Halomonas sp. SS10-MC5]QTP55780.1 transcriptional regulator [Halomonas sulfidoxydans]
MKFSLLVAIVPEDLEQECIDAATEAGAVGMTLMSGRGIGGERKKTFFGLTYEGSQSIMLLTLEKSLSLRVLKTIRQVLNPTGEDSRGLVMTLPVEHLGGIDMAQVKRFEERLRQDV